MGVSKQQLLNTVRQLKEYIDYTSGTYNLSKYLAKDNETEYTPTKDYHPATKKYVDDVAETVKPKISTEEGNSIQEKEDGLYVSVPTELYGKSAYDLAVANGFKGTEAEWLASLKGADGADGAPGAAGADGAPGVNGKDGVTPHIGDNGNWFIGDTDTGVLAKGGTDSVDISTKDGNALTKEADGLYVPSVAEISISTKDNNAITKNDDGIFVEDKTKTIETLNTKVESIQKYQKFLNTELDYCYCTLDGLSYTPVVNEYIPWAKKSGNLDITDGKFIVKAKQTVQITCGIGYQSSGSTEYGNISFSIRNETQNKVITNYYPNQGSVTLEHPQVLTLMYTNDTNEDNELGIYTYAVWTEDVLSPYSYLIVQETNREVVIDPVEHVNTTSGIEDTPVGHIMSFMGINAPDHYLICDGTEYEIEKYPYLAQHFKDNFGTINYFGGDGNTTFAVPDLRGEFLRGAGTATRDTGNGADVGEHQDPTYHKTLATVGTTTYFYPPSDETSFPENRDKYFGESKTGRTVSTSSGGNSAPYYSSRPTNTSVLYCIKYEPTYFMQTTGAMMNSTILYDQTIMAVGNYILKDDANNYDVIIVEHKAVSGATMSWVQYGSLYPDFDGTKLYHFNHGNSNVSNYINFTVSDNVLAVTDYSAEAITKIIGIKEIQATGSGDSSGNGSSSGGLDLTEEEIENLVDEAYNEAIKEIEGESGV